MPKEEQLDRNYNNHLNILDDLEWNEAESELYKEEQKRTQEKMKILVEKLREAQAKLFFAEARRFALTNFDDILKEEIGWDDYT
jgi:hypothetical protein